MLKMACQSRMHMKVMLIVFLNMELFILNSFPKVKQLTQDFMNNYGNV